MTQRADLNIAEQLIKSSKKRVEEAGIPLAPGTALKPHQAQIAAQEVFSLLLASSVLLDELKELKAKVERLESAK